MPDMTDFANSRHSATLADFPSSLWSQDMILDSISRCAPSDRFATVRL